MNFDIRLGKYGEEIAVKYLKNKGFRILDQNYRRNWSPIDKVEADIIAEKRKIFHFIEVKTSESSAFNRRFFNPEGRAGYQKQKKLANLAQIWLNEHKISLETGWQIDVLSILADIENKTARIRFFENVFGS